MAFDLNSRKYEWSIVFSFLISFLLLLSSQILFGLLILSLGLYLIIRQEKRLVAEDEKSPDISYAGFWVRAGSLSVDYGVFGLWYMFLYLVLRDKLWDYFNYFFYLFSFLLVEIYMLKRWGQTPGKMLMGIKVVKIDFSELSWREVFLRLFLEMINDAWHLLKAFLIYFGVITTGLFLVGSSSPHPFPSNFFHIFNDKLINLTLFWLLNEMIILLINHKKRALHDYLAGTVVIVKEKAGFKSGVWAGLFIVISIGYLIFAIFNPSREQFLAEKGEPLYEQKLGYDYYTGKLTVRPQNYSVALQWFQKAADQDDPNAQFYLGEMYEKGCGVTANRAKAIEWYSLAAKNDSVKAKQALKRLNVN